MTKEAKHAIDTLVEARKYVWEKCAEEKIDSDENVEAIWEGYLTFISALYTYPQPDYRITLDPTPGSDEP